jgi:hypothetical protein
VAGSGVEQAADGPAEAAALARLSEGAWPKRAGGLRTALWPREIMSEPNEQEDNVFPANILPPDDSPPTVRPSKRTRRSSANRGGTRQDRVAFSGRLGAALGLISYLSTIRPTGAPGGSGSGLRAEAPLPTSRPGAAVGLAQRAALRAGLGIPRGHHNPAYFAIRGLQIAADRCTQRNPGATAQGRNRDFEVLNGAPVIDGYFTRHRRAGC